MQAAESRIRRPFDPLCGAPRRDTRSESGFTLLELLISITILMIVSGVALDGVFRLTKVSQTVSNRTEMHSGVRNATELLQQEVGQAGRISLPNIVQLNGHVDGDPDNAVTVAVQVVDSNGVVITTNGVDGTDGMFKNEYLVIDTGDKQETVELTAAPANKQITGKFRNSHDPGAPVNVYGGFRYGVIPKSIPDGSTADTLKMLGDINSDGKLEYVEYKCDTAQGNLYRRTAAYNATAKPQFTINRALLNNITANPDNTDCFTYQEALGHQYLPFVVDVAITLTVHTPDKDPVTGLYQKETKALLNVSPRNVFNVWQLDGQGYTNRVQPLPDSVKTLMALP